MRAVDADKLKERAIRVSTVKEHCYMKAVGTQEIDKAQTLDVVNRGVFDQVMWERDVAIGQLESLGISLGQKFGCEHCKYKRMSDRNLWCDIFEKIMPENGYCCFFEFDT